ncbi:MAG TPA: glycogen debranching protein GlgX [Acidimicrobiia bacterium]|nr:glycogen debranching protein GlgX [Acidimicrobiia bacterium]
MRVTRGHDTLGATPEDAGVNFGVWSSVATAVHLCLFDGDAEHIVELPARTGNVFHGHVEGIGAGIRYGFRVDGPWDPVRGHRCNPTKLLVDPYARLLDPPRSDTRLLVGHAAGSLNRADHRDSAPVGLRSVVVDGAFDWGEDRPLSIPLADSIIYETHVKGMTVAHPGVPEELRGTYAGLAHPTVIEHLQGLGVTAVELLPVHQFIHDQFLLDRGLRNYWGYNTIGFFAPHRQYAATADPISEFKGMVRLLHAGGIEVILDVVFNHTAEGNHLGPTLSFRGLDNKAYYRLDPPAHYVNWTGTGNTVDLSADVVLRLVMDSLRYWVEEMHVDGFRFDLATTLGRTHADFDPLGGFFGAVAQDPVLGHTKLIAEPWDVGPNGYRVGQFPTRWSEWNDTYRDTVRDFWKATPATVGAFGDAVTGSSPLYEMSGRDPTASVNLVTSHDGFTLRDLVSYDHTHNDANGESNHDGHQDNRSWNSGAEGPTDDPVVLEIRARRTRAMLVSLLLSQGVPMLLGGDELGRTQQGNNNAYNQDNDISWLDWSSVDCGLASFVGRLATLRRRHPTFRRTAWLHEHAAADRDLVGWFRPSGEEMTVEDWGDPNGRSVALYLAGQVVHCTEGTVTDHDVLLLFNGDLHGVGFRIPPAVGHEEWTLVVDSAHPERTEAVSGSVEVDGLGAVVLMRPPG